MRPTRHPIVSATFAASSPNLFANLDISTRPAVPAIERTGEDPRRFWPGMGRWLVWAWTSIVSATTAAK